MAEYELSNPVVELTFNEPPSKAFVAAFFALSLLGAIVVGWLYVVTLPNFVGFEKTLLLGVLLIIFGEA
jgi:hypothetical protein